MTRAARLAQVLAQQGVGAYFVTSAPTMQYLFGYAEEGMERFLAVAVSPRGEVRFIGPALAAEQALRGGIEDVRTWSDGQSPDPHLADLARDWGLDGSAVAVDAETRADHLLRITAAIPGATARSGAPCLSQLTRKKDPTELASLRRAASIADAALDAALDGLPAGATEAQLAERLVHAMRASGGSGGGAIVAAGPFGAEPHHGPSDKPLEPGDLVIADFGCTVDGYFSDITRTFAVGHADDEHHRAYDAVLRAHQAGRAAAKPGATCHEVDAATRAVIEQEGLGEYFVHRTGHGIGLRIHEEPFLTPGNDTPLMPGDCFSIEPGVYLPGRFGVRIENIYNLTDQGCESLNADPASALRLVKLAKA